MIEKLFISNYNCALGNLTIAATSQGICMIEFDNQTRIENHLKQLKQFFNYEIIDQSNELIDIASTQLSEYLNGSRKIFDFPFLLHGTDFQTKVWNELLTISYGTIRSYKEQALAIGNLKAIRAIATANGQNRISIVIPCHRIIGSDGSLTGYGGELWRKKFLLELESNQAKLF